MEQPAAAAAQDLYSADHKADFKQRDAPGGLRTPEEGAAAARAALLRSEAARLSASKMMDAVESGPGGAQPSDGAARDGRAGWEG